MTPDQPTPPDQPTSAKPGGDDPAGFDIPDFSFPDPTDLRRAVRLGVLRTGFTAACWVLLAVVLLTVAWVGAGGVRSGPFVDLVLRGVQVAHPEYEITENRFTNFGYSTMELGLQARGEIGGHGMSLGRAEQPVIGDFTVELGDSDETPVLRALAHTPPTKSATTAYLDSLPAGVSASAVVAFARPLDPDAYADFASRAIATAPLETAVYFTDPYADQAVISWPTSEIAEYVKWARDLDAGDDALRRLDLPPAAQLRAVADNPQVRAFVVAQASVPDLRKLLADPLVGSVNIADVGFDVSGQFPQN